MNQRHDENDRRVLKFPAVHPCEDISSVALIESLISLSHSILKAQSKFFATQRRNSRETIRQIELLLVFLEEIREQRCNLSSSTVLCFSELHVAFQKIKLLLEDCSREGARVWILMKAHFVATQFRGLIRSVATALDVLPLSSIHVSADVKELVELVSKQAQKAKLELHPEDDNIMKRVILILNQFENKFEPDLSIIKPVLDYLGITTWSDCHKEIRFLDEEISLDYLDGNEREVPLLSSLSAFMCYCRVVMFENSNFSNTDHSEARCSIDTLSCLNPEDFRCPISLELMTDPVTVSTGQTYDRASIQKWLTSGNLLCPKTGKMLATTVLVPNSSLRKLIYRFLEDNGVSIAKFQNKSGDISRTIVAGSSPAAEAIKFLSQFISNQLYCGTEEQKNKAAYEIRLLAKSSIFNRSCLIEAGTIPPLLRLLASINPPIQENAISALLKLSKHSNGKREIINCGGLKPIVAVLKEGIQLDSRQIAAATIFYLSSVPNYRRLIGGEPNVIPALVELIRNGTTFGKKNSLAAIFGLLLYHRNHQRVLSAGTVPLLVDVLASSDKADVITDLLAVLAEMAEKIDGSNEILRASSALPTIMRVFHSTTSRTGKEHCVSILLSLCNNCGVDAIAVLVKDSSLMGSLYSLLTEGTSHASKKARSLIKIIHKFHETSSACLVNHDVQRTRIYSC